MSSSRYAKENIPDEDLVYSRYHQTQLHHGNILHPGIIRQQGLDGVSCDWNKYSTPQGSRRRANVPSLNGVVEFLVFGIRSVDGFDVIHDPLDKNDDHGPNQAHSLITGLSKCANKTKCRMQLFEYCRSVIHYSEPV